MLLGKAKGKRRIERQPYISADSIKAGDGRSPSESTMKTQVGDSGRLTTTRRRYGDNLADMRCAFICDVLCETRVLTKETVRVTKAVQLLVVNRLASLLNEKKREMRNFRLLH